MTVVTRGDLNLLSRTCWEYALDDTGTENRSGVTIVKTAVGLVIGTANS